MAFFSTDKFVSNVVAITVAVIIFAMVAVPIIASAAASEAIAGNEQLQMILNVIPIFIVIGILLACIYMFLNKNTE